MSISYHYPIVHLYCEYAICKATRISWSNTALLPYLYNAVLVCRYWLYPDLQFSREKERILSNTKYLSLYLVSMTNFYILHIRLLFTAGIAFGLRTLWLYVRSFWVPHLKNFSGVPSINWSQIKLKTVWFGYLKMLAKHCKNLFSDGRT